VGVGGLGGGHDLLFRRVGLAVKDVLPDTGGEQHRFLRDQPNLLPQPLQLQLSDVHAVEPDGTREGVVEALDELDDRGLPRAALTDEGDRGPRGNREGELGEYGGVRARGIGEGDVLKG